MSRITWDADGERLFETGVKNGVLYLKNNSGVYANGVAWNGLTSVSESPSGAEATALYADDIKYLNLMSAEEFGGTIEAYMYPDEFMQCDGSASITTGVVIGQQARKPFGLCYRTTIGSDSDGNDHGYKLHLVYGCLASPSQRSYETINDSPSAITFSWEFKTTPVNVSAVGGVEYKPTALITVDSTTATAANLKVLEACLYGASEFSATSTYAVGDMVCHETKLYQCSTAITTASAWDASKWTEIAGATGAPMLPLPDMVRTIMTPANIG